MLIKSSTHRAPPAPTSHRERVSERTREEILLTAARLVARGGHHPVSLHDIAAELGLTAPALYVYFDGKQAIFAEMVKLLDREVVGLFDPPVPRGAPFPRRLGQLLRRHFDLADRRRDLFLALFSLHTHGEPIGPPHGPPTGYIAGLRAWFEREPGPGDLGGCSPDEATCFFLGIAKGFFMRWLLAGDGSRLADQTDRVADLFFHGVAGSAGEAVPPPAPRRGARPPRRSRRPQR
jgi:AcrR family transcriptional regulator